jgi:hypothetical protein
MITADKRTKLDLTEPELASVNQYHPDGYSIPPYPTITFTAVPPWADDTLLHNPSPTLLYVRGMGDNFDAQNILIPLIIDNLIQVTELTRTDIFGIPLTLQAKSPLTQKNRIVLIEEQVIAVLFNPATVSPAMKLRALQSLGLADSTMTTRVLLRSIPVEFIVNSDVLLIHPVPLSERINMILIPMVRNGCGEQLTQLLIASSFSPFHSSTIQQIGKKRIPTSAALPFSRTTRNVQRLCGIGSQGYN